MIPTNFQISPLSESAIVLGFGNTIDRTLNTQVLALAEAIQASPFPGFTEVLPAYSSLTVFYDIFAVRKAFPHTPAYHTVRKILLDYITTDESVFHSGKDMLVKIPVCYSEVFGWDWKEVYEHTGISREEVIAIHTATIYRVYMMGFLPGFPYLGGMDSRIATPRKSQPRLKVEAGSVGIAGEQTGVYPLDSPGGWQVIGKTPVKLFDPTTNKPVLLKAGDQVQFYEIDEDTFYTWNSAKEV
ncbi:5-oxoprolinase subunit PxpB [Cytophagaceae bacterium YF14B1]|uniref:5-oxoprolinase subunit PxpB n=1 Tax=Xanthocytophaga flava TaxID=3048013 RepID=A0AAE3U7J7_9BACT|nr:5-oxoprolinase subunit PxpB [Xanthocytophaga flavus]MDJ1480183.1 5-oxoprolinase subunit PxpB [Xanthocytophaga flavus]